MNNKVITHQYLLSNGFKYLKDTNDYVKHITDIVQLEVCILNKRAYVNLLQIPEYKFNNKQSIFIKAICLEYEFEEILNALQIMYKN